MRVSLKKGPKNPLFALCRLVVDIGCHSGTRSHFQFFRPCQTPGVIFLLCMGGVRVGIISRDTRFGHVNDRHALSHHVGRFRINYPTPHDRPLRLFNSYINIFYLFLYHAHISSHPRIVDNL